jgi:hypothetical protein
MSKFLDIVYRVTLVNRAAKQNADLAKEAYFSLCNLIGKEPTVEIEKEKREFITRSSMHAVQAHAAAARALREFADWTNASDSLFDEDLATKSRGLLMLVKDTEAEAERAMGVATKAIDVYGLHTYTEIKLW